MKISAELDEGGVIVPAPAPCLLLFNQVIRGNATHLGRFEGVGSACILDVVIPDPVRRSWPRGRRHRTATFSNPLWVLTAANGDELWLEGADGVAVVSLVDNSLRAEGIQTIIGGTGRFEGAIGELESEAVNEDGQGPNDFESRGWIRF